MPGGQGGVEAERVDAGQEPVPGTDIDRDGTVVCQ